MIRTLVFLGAGALSALVANALMGPTGLRGAAVGLGIALIMCLASALLLRLARRGSGNAILGALLGGVAVSFAIMVGSMILLARLWREVLEPATLTALTVYLACRFVEALEASRAASGTGHGALPAKGAGAESSPPGPPKGAQLLMARGPGEDEHPAKGGSRS